MNYDEVSEVSKKISEVLKLLIYVGCQNVQVLFYGGRINSDFDTVVIYSVGSLLYCIMDSYHKMSLVCLTALLLIPLYKSYRQ